MDLCCCGNLRGGLRESYGCNGELRGVARDYGCLDCYRVLKVVGAPWETTGNYNKIREASGRYEMLRELQDAAGSCERLQEVMKS